MEPIMLTEFGETLREPSSIRFTEDVKFPKCIYSYIGVHDICRGFLYVRPVSKTHNVIFCGNCVLRVLIPNEVDTYGKLWQWCAEEIRRQDDKRIRLAIKARTK
jgi:hypothetical protein